MISCIVLSSGLVTGIYLTNTPDAVRHVMEDSHSNIAIVDTDAQLQKMLAIRDLLPELKAIVMWSGQPREKYPNVYTVGLRFKFNVQIQNWLFTRGIK